ncbi:two-component response regulator-like APRR5 [Tasmannia lanceolata]|uniref:two-component response regulator-like APRR5 n=1 Tax=Tasmannia lanceolata TaxID=3420 RepID=UPI00406447A2
MERRGGEEGASNAVLIAGKVEEGRIRGSNVARNWRESKMAGGEEQVIRWERVLPRRFLRVLVVEHDDSTRHIVSALLRKCSYKVVAVADGLKAWEVLKENNYNFDLVLTEVVMPSLSGISLLSKIMSNDICKNIPVIMMSSHDSMGIVFKCMLKGAADFLVKPVRKNELKNLWQHVWRKYCPGSCGNGSRNENPNQTKNEAMSYNNDATNNKSANAGNRSMTGDGCEEGSDTQSSCSKPEIEIESKENQEEQLQTENMKFSSEIESKFEKYDCDTAKVLTSPMHNSREAQGNSKGIEINETLSIQAAVSTEKIQEENSSNDRSPCRGDNPCPVICKEGASINPNSFYQTDVPNEPSTEIIDFIGRIASGQCRYPVLEENAHKEDVLCRAEKSSDASKTACNFTSSPLWELSLRRPQLNGCNEHGFQERHILKHSHASAFSRYGNTGCLSCPTPGSSPASLCDRPREYGINFHVQPGSDGTGNGKTISFSANERLTPTHGNGGEGLMYHQLSSGSNNEDAEWLAVGPIKEDACITHSFTKEQRVFSHSQLGVISLPIPVGAIPYRSLCADYGGMLQPVFYSQPNNLQQINSYNRDQNHHLHQTKQEMKGHRINIEPTDPRLVLDVPSEKANISGNCSQSVLNSRENNEDMNAAVNTRAIAENGNDRREASLIKFRLKRKDRCFEKKVRYQSRKKLAEQRPRLKGQFVRQASIKSTTPATETDD